ncbi:hypothetical protein LTR28_004038 [Elasticomyces elasticus]|nr:hypothetical protein LTR28_004038 [Elasticomyces elasticus]
MSDRPAKAGAKQTAVIALRKRTSIAIVCHKEENTDEANLSERAIATPKRITQLQDEPGKGVEDNEASLNPDAAETRTHSAEARGPDGPMVDQPEYHESYTVNEPVPQPLRCVLYNGNGETVKIHKHKWYVRWDRSDPKLVRASVTDADRWREAQGRETLEKYTDDNNKFNIAQYRQDSKPSLEELRTAYNDRFLSKGRTEVGLFST